MDNINENKDENSKAYREDVISKGKATIDMYDLMSRQSSKNDSIMKAIEDLFVRIDNLEQTVNSMSGQAQGGQQQESVLDKPVQVREPQQGTPNILDQLLSGQAQAQAPQQEAE